VVWFKIEVFGAGRTERTAKPTTAGIGPNHTGPAGFRPAGARCVKPLDRCAASRFTSFLPDHRAGRETEAVQSGWILL